MVGNREGAKELDTSRGTEREGQGMTSSYLWGYCLLGLCPMCPMGPICKFHGLDPGRGWVQSVYIGGLSLLVGSITPPLAFLLPCMRNKAQSL